MPAGAVAGSTIPEDTEAEILLQDGTWAWAQVTGQRKDRHGRWCVGLRRYAAQGGRPGRLVTLRPGSHPAASVTAAVRSRSGVIAMA